jgi:hypothetical protein
MELEVRFKLSRFLPIANVIYDLIDNLPNVDNVELCGVPYVLLPRAARYFDKYTQNAFGVPPKEKKIFTFDEFETIEVVRVDNPEETKLYIFKMLGGNGLHEIALIIKDSSHFRAVCSIFDVWWFEEDKLKFVMERLPFNMESADEKEKSDFIWTSAHVSRRLIAVATFLYTFVNFDFEGTNPQLRLCGESSKDYAITVKEKIRSLGSDFAEIIGNLEMLSYLI